MPRAGGSGRSCTAGRGRRTPRGRPTRAGLLRDRTLVNEGRKHVYGTQIAGVKDGSPIAWPCEEPERMDELRAEVGIEPFDEYVAKFATA